MKTILKISVLAIIVCAGCKKKEDQVSQLATTSYPTVTLTGSQYYSIPIDGTLPQIAATAYDSFYKESCPVTIDQSTLNNNVAGLYIVQAVAKNRYGYIGTANVFIGVTNVPATEDLSGLYTRTSNNIIVLVTKLANGMYQTNNFGGVDTATSPGANYPAVFVQTNDTTIDFGSSVGQPTGAGTLVVTDAQLTTVPGDTSYSYIVNASGFGTSKRTFVKQ